MHPQAHTPSLKAATGCKPTHTPLFVPIVVSLELGGLLGVQLRLRLELRLVLLDQTLLDVLGLRVRPESSL